MNPSDYYQKHLDRVSRSFSFCIQQLPEPLRAWVGLSYLLCRLVDTIEDSNWKSASEQLEMFHFFDRCVVEELDLKALKGWEQRFPSDLPVSEVKLLVDAHILLADLHKLEVYEIIRDLVRCMSQGMQHFCRQRQDGSLRLKSLREVNQYCFFVAGVVGELLAMLLAKVEPQVELNQQTVLRAHHFGLFLQKVNLLKDQVGDEKVGRHLIPSRPEVEASAEVNAQNALAFLIGLPKEQLEFRRFCAWSLFLGLESLKVARSSFGEQRVLKISRRNAEALLLEVEAALGDDGALRAQFLRGCQALGWNLNASALAPFSEDIPLWFADLYGGKLARESLQQLGL